MLEFWWAHQSGKGKPLFGERCRGEGCGLVRSCEWIKRHDVGIALNDTDYFRRQLVRVGIGMGSHEVLNERGQADDAEVINHLVELGIPRVGYIGHREHINNLGLRWTQGH